MHANLVQSLKHCSTEMKSNIYVEISCRKVNCHSDRICGDSFVQRYIPSQNRTIAILSDGMGHGIKANVLSTLTTSIILNMVEGNESLQTIARTILKTLPVCSVRKISYSTFTIFNYNHYNNQVSIIEYDNPQSIIVRHGAIFSPEWDCQEIEDELTHTNRRTILTTTYQAERGDRIVFCSDGVTQSGMGSDSQPFGWGRTKLQEYILTTTNHTTIAAHDLAQRIVQRAIILDKDVPRDDISCVVIHLREPQKLLFCSVPPTVEVKSREIAGMIAEYNGKTAISGYPLAELIAREWDVPIHKNLTSTDPDVPPIWKINGLNLVTEGLITLGKVLDILEKRDSGSPVRGRGGAYRLCDLLMEADIIEMVVGLAERITTSSVWRDDYVLRRKILRAISEILEKKYNKQVKVQYV